MSRFRALKYLLVFTMPALAYLSFHTSGIWTFAPVIEVFVLIPFLELLLPPNAQNLNAAEREIAQKDPMYDYLIYLIAPVVFWLGYEFCVSMTAAGLPTADRIGRITSMGVVCGSLGINVGHELGHRKKYFERLLAKALLLSSFYMHFYIEHNRGHHKNVSTPEDPASARYGETVFAFWIRSIVLSYLSAWRLELDRLAKQGKSSFSFSNEMILFHLVQLGFAGLIAVIFSPLILGYYALAALMGVILLETVNYIEHYGLQRQKTENNRYERVRPHHSWNSNHPVGRLMLFELSRHSDHHYLASKKYQVLENHDDAPCMPTGYPGMMVLALIPPLWFSVMHTWMKNQKVTA